jgi:hypothetical protein
MCAACGDMGFVPFADVDNPTPDDAMTADDLRFAVCLCDTGATWRRRENEGRTVAPLWLVWCAKHRVSTERVCMVEDVFTAEELAAAGLTKAGLSMLSREAALLNASKRREKR